MGFGGVDYLQCTQVVEVCVTSYLCSKGTRPLVALNLYRLGLKIIDVEMIPTITYLTITSMYYHGVLAVVGKLHLYITNIPNTLKNTC